MSKKGRPKLGDKVKRSSMLVIRLNDREKEQLKSICYDYDISKSEFIRMAIKKYYHD